MVTETLQNFAQKAADVLCDLSRFTPPATPAPRIVAHRGAWDGGTYLENTLSSFKRAQNLSAWGIEFDVHFTRDGVAVVNHDPHLRRGHNHGGVLCEMNFSELQAAASAVPTAEQVLALKNLHFMIEIKTQMSAPQIAALTRHLARLKPVADYHLLALDPALVRTSSAMPPESWILVGEFNLPSLTRAAIDRNLGGVAGHYLLMTKALIQDLHEHRKQAGAGFSPTKNLFHREWSRGVDWVFTNHAATICEPRS